MPNFPLPDQQTDQSDESNATSQDQQDTDSTQDQTQQTTQQQDSPTSDSQSRYVQLLEDTLKEQARQIREQSQNIEHIRNRVDAPPPPPPVDPEAERQEYYTDPKAATRKVVKELLDESIAPLRDFVQEMRGQTLSQRYIESVKSDPRFAAQWDSNIEGAVMQAIQSVPPNQVTEQFVQAATVQAIGMKYAGMFGPITSTPAPAPANTNSNGSSMTTPPHVRPSTPAAPRNSGNRPPVQLSELEMRLARERRMSPEEYVAWRDLDPKDVAASTIGRPQNK